MSGSYKTVVCRARIASSQSSNLTSNESRRGRIFSSFRRESGMRGRCQPHPDISGMRSRTGAPAGRLPGDTDIGTVRWSPAGAPIRARPRNRCRKLCGARHRTILGFNVSQACGKPRQRGYGPCASGGRRSTRHKLSPHQSETNRGNNSCPRRRLKHMVGAQWQWDAAGVVLLWGPPTPGRPRGPPMSPGPSVAVAPPSPRPQGRGDQGVHPQQLRLYRACPGQCSDHSRDRIRARQAMPRLARIQAD